MAEDRWRDIRVQLWTSHRFGRYKWSQGDVSGNHRTVSIFKIYAIGPRSYKNKRPFRIDEKIFA